MRQFGFLAQMRAYPNCPCLTVAIAVFAIRFAASKSRLGSCSFFVRCGMARSLNNRQASKFEYWQRRVLRVLKFA